MYTVFKTSLFLASFASLLTFTTGTSCRKVPMGCPYYNPQMMCPEQEPKCIDSTQCTGGQICCRINCVGSQCVDPVKPGSCPPNTMMCVQPSPGLPYPGMCTKDSDCPCQQKCCYTCPGPTCMNPNWKLTNAHRKRIYLFRGLLILNRIDTFINKTIVQHPNNIHIQYIFIKCGTRRLNYFHSNCILFLFLFVHCSNYITCF